MLPQNRIDLRLHRKQAQAYESPATEILYGGAAYGGKSHLMRVASIAWCAAIRGLQIYLFRRTFDDLYKNHIFGPTGFPAMLAPWLRSGYAKFNDSKHIISIGPDSKIHLCHCQHEKDRFDYQGAEMHVLMVDELTHFSRTIYAYLRSRVRLGGLEVPEALRGVFPRILNGSNPGAVGHNWVKADFIDPAPSYEVWRTSPDQGGMLRQFIPSRLEDNPTVLAHEEDYASKLEGIGDPALARAMRYGDWNIVSGGMFDDVWDESIHVCPTFDVPITWSLDRAHDWGDSKPFCTLWFAESNGESVMVDGQPRSWPRGHLFVIAEDYGWNGVPNVGLKLTSAEIARRVVTAEHEMNIRGRVKPGPGDIPDMVNGTSPRDQYARVGAQFRPVDKKPGSRVAGWQQVRQALKASLRQPQEEPGLTIFNRCRNLIRVLPTAPRDPRKPEDLDTESEDHALDPLRYRVVLRRYATGVSQLLG